VTRMPPGYKHIS